MKSYSVQTKQQNQVWKQPEKEKRFMTLWCLVGGSAHRTTWLLSTQLLQVSLVQGHSARGLHAMPSPSSPSHESQPTTTQPLALYKSKPCNSVQAFFLSQNYSPLYFSRTILLEKLYSEEFGRIMVQALHNRY